MWLRTHCSHMGFQLPRPIHPRIETRTSKENICVRWSSQGNKEALILISLAHYLVEPRCDIPSQQACHPFVCSLLIRRIQTTMSHRLHHCQGNPPQPRRSHPGIQTPTSLKVRYVREGCNKMISHLGCRIPWFPGYFMISFPTTRPTFI